MDMDDIHRAIVDQSQLAILLWQGNPPTIVFANQKACEVSGYEKQDLLSLSFQELSDFIHPDDRERTVKNLLAIWSEEPVQQGLRFRGVRRNGTVVWLEFSGSLVSLEGQPAALIILLDVSQTIRAETKLQESEEKYRQLVSVSPNAITMTDLEGKFTFVNKQALLLHGFKSEEEMIGTSALDVIAPEEHELAIENMQRTLQEGSIKNVEYTLLRKDGSRFPAELDAAVLHNAEGQPTAFIAITRDVSDRKAVGHALTEERDRAQLYLDLAGVMFVALNIRGEIILLNKRASEILKCDTEESLGRNWFDTFIPQTLRDDVRAAFAALMRGEIEGVDRYENSVITADGEERIIRWHNVVLTDESGTPIGTLSSGEDITEQRATEARYQHLFETAPVAIAISNEEGMILEANRWMQQLTGYSWEELSELPAARLYANPEDRPIVLHALGETGKLVDFEVRFRRKDGSTFIALLSEEIVEFTGRKVMFASFRDVTEQQQVQDALRRAADTAILYLDIMQHDLRNYLQAIMLGADILQHAELGVEFRGIFELIVESVENSQALIKQVQATRGLLSVPLTEVTFLEMIKECVQSLEETFEDVIVEIDDGGLNPIIFADIFIKQLLMNLLRNAVIHNNSKVRRVWITLKESEDGIVFCISDNGDGIEEGRKIELFDPERRFGGLGIHQAKSIIDKYSGRITVHDRVPGDYSQGSEFRVWIPKSHPRHVVKQ